uniref:Uncharacterized protein n=1 Tax=Arundo donax TaxID=35708 RepID=A0A0A9G441_ARUDO
MDAAGKSPEPAPPPTASAAAISAVLSDGDLLREILLCLGFPSYLVRAALVSKHWLRHASDPSFLRRFRERHPPRLLGFYCCPEIRGLHFVPMPQPPELASVVRRGRFEVGHDPTFVSDCRNGRLVVAKGNSRSNFALFSPLHPARGTTALPRLQIPVAATRGECESYWYSRCVLLPEDGGDGMSCTAVTLMSTDRGAWVHLSDLQAGVWGEGRSSDSIELPQRLTRCLRLLLAYGKLYIMCMARYILCLDLLFMSLFCIKLPDGVECDYDTNLGLSRAEGPGFCLIHVKGFQIRVWWCYSTDSSSSTGEWKLVDTICLHQAFGHLAEYNWQPGDALVHVAAVGDNADFVFLRIEHEIFYCHVFSRAVEKVYELNPNRLVILHAVHPLMTVWPPIFPALNDERDQDE